MEEDRRGSINIRLHDIIHFFYTSHFFSAGNRNLETPKAPLNVYIFELFNVYIFEYLFLNTATMNLFCRP